jgi:hypothetical protein
VSPPVKYNKSEPSIVEAVVALESEKSAKSTLFAPSDKTIEDVGSEDIWVDGVLVFSNLAVDLEIHAASITVVKVRELVDFIRLSKNGNFLSSSEVTLVGKIICMHVCRD